MHRKKSRAIVVVIDLCNVNICIPIEMYVFKKTPACEPASGGQRVPPSVAAQISTNWHIRSESLPIIDFQRMVSFACCQSHEFIFYTWTKRSFVICSKKINAVVLNTWAFPPIKLQLVIWRLYRYEKIFKVVITYDC